MTDRPDDAAVLAAERFLDEPDADAASLRDPAFCEALAEAVLLRDALTEFPPEPVVVRRPADRRSGRRAAGVAAAAALSLAIAAVVSMPPAGSEPDDGSALVAAAWDDVRTHDVQSVVEDLPLAADDADVPVWMLAAVEFSESEAPAVDGLETL